MLTRHAADHRVTPSLILIAALFIGSGILHFIKTAFFVSIMPPWLPAPRMLVLISGVCEMLGAVGVLIPATRVAAGWGLIALLIAVFPANVHMLLANTNPSRLWQAGLIARLPLQGALIYWVYRSVVRYGT